MTGLSLLCSYLKSGNTWLRIVLDCVLNERAEIQLNKLYTIPIISHRSDFDDVMGVDSSDLTTAEIMQSHAEFCRQLAAGNHATKIRKVHHCFSSPSPDVEPPIPIDVLNKVVYIVRDPRDIAVSLAHHFNQSVERTIAMMGDSSTTLEAVQTSYRLQLPQHLSSWSRHVESWLDNRDINLHLIRYEDMVAAPLDTFHAVIQFLNLQCERTRLEQILNICRFDALQKQEENDGFRERPKNSAVFFRRGIAGGWRHTLTAQQAQTIVGEHGAVMRRLRYL